VGASYEHTNLGFQSNFLCDLGCTRVFGWTICAIPRKSTRKPNYLREKAVVFPPEYFKTLLRFDSTAVEGCTIYLEMWVWLRLQGKDFEALGKYTC